MKLWKKQVKESRSSTLYPCALICLPLLCSLHPTPSLMLFSSPLCWLSISPLFVHCCPLVCCFVPSSLKVPSVASEGLVIVTSQLGCRTRKETRTAQWSEALEWPEPQSHHKSWETPFPKLWKGHHNPALPWAQPGVTGEGAQRALPASYWGWRCCPWVLQPPYRAGAIPQDAQDGRAGWRKHKFLKLWVKVFSSSFPPCQWCPQI